VRDPAELWSIKRRSLDRACRSARRGDAEGLHDVRVALRRISATAGALSRRDLARRAKKLVRSLSGERQLEVDRQLLTRVGRIGLLSPDAVTALAARWEALAARRSQRLERTCDGKEVRALLKKVSRLSRAERSDAVDRLERARRRAESVLAVSLEGQNDRAMHRYRVAVKRARYLAEDLATLGLRQWKTHAERERAIQEALGRWNDLRMFARRIAGNRAEAEARGAVTLAAELGHVVAALESAVASARRAAVEASKTKSQVSGLKSQVAPKAGLGT